MPIKENYLLKEIIEWCILNIFLPLYLNRCQILAQNGVSFEDLEEIKQIFKKA